jgi:hypothetical protein
MESKDAAKNLLKPESTGIHCLVIYHDLNTCREFYSFYIQKIIDNDDEIVQIAPFYETGDSVRYALTHRHHNRASDLNKIEKGNKKSLIILDSLEKYLPQSDTKDEYEAIQQLVRSANRLGKKRVSILGDSGAFFFKKKVPQLIEYELSLPTHFEFNVKGICLYHQKDFAMLPEQVRQKLVNHHEKAIKIR